MGKQPTAQKYLAYATKVASLRQRRGVEVLRKWRALRHRSGVGTPLT